MSTRFTPSTWLRVIARTIASSSPFHRSLACQTPIPILDTFGPFFPIVLNSISKNHPTSRVDLSYVPYLYAFFQGVAVNAAHAAGTSPSPDDENCNLLSQMSQL